MAYPHCGDIRLPIALFLAFYISASVGIAQELTCETSTPQQEFLTEESPYSEASDVFVVFLYLHILRQGNGSGGLSVAAVDSVLSTLDDDFGAVGIYFRVIGQSEIENSTYYNDPVGYASWLFAINAHSDAIDVYLGPNSGTAESKAEAIPSKAAVATGTLLGTSGLSHVLGHCVGLYDTDETAWGSETPGGSDGDSKGDLIVDTAADPGLSGYVDASCDLTAAFMSMFPSHDPDVDNVMGAGRMSCWVGFCAEQGARMRTALESATGLNGVAYTTPVEYEGKDHTVTGLVLPVVYPHNATAVDYDNDGDKDMLICTQNTAGNAFQQINMLVGGIPVFGEDDLAFPLSTHIDESARGIIMADYDNDGDIDFYAPNPTGTDENGHEFFINENTLVLNTLLGREASVL